MGEFLEDYFKSKGCDYWRKQEKAYGSINFRYRSVVIIGADCGTTALYALIKRASYLVMYESDPKLRQKLYEVMDDFNISRNKYEIHGEWRGNEYPPADVFIQDCEGCEQYDNFEYINRYEQVCIAVHTWSDLSKTLKHLVGYKVTYVTPDSKEMVFCRKKMHPLRRLFGL
jgi:hypothetical protein